MKPCLQCGSPAQFSLCIVISTLGVSNRRQKCTKARSLCASCLQRVFTIGAPCSSAGIAEALGEAYRALTSHSLSQADTDGDTPRRRVKENGEPQSTGIDTGIRTPAEPSASSEVIEIASRYIEEKGTSGGDPRGQGRQELEVPRQPAGRLD